MKKALNYIYFSLFAFWLVIVLFGCSAEKKCQRELIAIQTHCPELLRMKDTTIYKTHDTIIYYHDTFTSPAESGQASFNIDSIVKAYNTTHKKVTVTKHFKGGTATLTDSAGTFKDICHTDSFKLVCTHKDSIIEKQATLIKTGIAIKYLPALPTFWDELYKGWFWVSLALLIVGIVALILKSKI
jgi:hypothetical protein